MTVHGYVMIYVQLTLKIAYPVLVMLDGKCFRSPVGMATCDLFSVSVVRCVASKFGSLSSLL